MEKKPKLNPTDRDIIRSISGNKLGATPSKIAKTINIHPVTAQKHVQKLSKLGYLDCEKKGNRTYCKVNRDKLKKGLS